MASKFQKRLTGTIVLVTLGVIILPDLFDGQKQHVEEAFDSIPLQEPVDDKLTGTEILAPREVEVNLPEDPVSVTVGEPENTETFTVTATDEAQQAEPDEGSQASSAGAWIIQLGVFRNHDNAVNLADRLRDKGYRAQVIPNHAQAGKLTRVIVGPDVSKDKLEGMTGKLESLTGLKGQLLKFNPINP
ncbi:SPOR domain-containing protein [Parasalinivibrio latis]|uniref:SPOR domain-containing protein n=1 Tax=Parasalinivibrio latis TaxID=2952610 RepID=UPI0030E451EB